MTWLSLSSVLAAQGPDASSDKGFMVGIGSASCLKLTNYTNEYEVPADLLPWIKGFWSGLNLAKGAQDKSDVNLAVPAAEDAVVQERIFAECYADQSRTVYSVAMQLYFEFPAVGASSN
ncbi:MAG: hypothetical protein WAT09_19655 [Paracoccaceae bacterium]